MASIMQGTTPSLTITFSPDDLQLSAGGIMPVLFNCDGRSKVCSAAIIIGTTSATQSDTYMIRDLTTDFYK